MPLTILKTSWDNRPGGVHGGAKGVIPSSRMAAWSSGLITFPRCRTYRAGVDSLA